MISASDAEASTAPKKPELHSEEAGLNFATLHQGAIEAADLSRGLKSEYCVRRGLTHMETKKDDKGRQDTRKLAHKQL